jgi:hypothetical protein
LARIVHRICDQAAPADLIKQHIASCPTLCHSESTVKHLDDRLGVIRSRAASSFQDVCDAMHTVLAAMHVCVLFRGVIDVKPHVSDAFHELVSIHSVLCDFGSAPIEDPSRQRNDCPAPHGINCPPDSPHDFRIRIHQMNFLRRLRRPLPRAEAEDRHHQLNQEDVAPQARAKELCATNA